MTVLLDKDQTLGLYTDSAKVRQQFVSMHTYLALFTVIEFAPNASPFNNVITLTVLVPMGTD